MSNTSKPDLPSDVLWTEKTTLIGDALSDMFYGAMVVSFLQAMHALLGFQRRQTSERPKLVLIIFNVTLFALGTIFVGMDLHSLQLGFIDNRGYPGGPTAYLASEFSNAISVFPNACFILTAWLADGFLLYRCILVFRFEPYITAVPVLMYLGSIAMGLMVLFQASQPGATLWTKISINFGLPYFSLSMSLNVIVTMLIATRLLLSRRELLRTLGPERVSFIPYVSISAMIVESSMFYAVFSLLFIGTYAAKSPLSRIFLRILSQVQIIAPMLITFRVATRRAWDSSTATAMLSSMKFNARGQDSENTGSTLDASNTAQMCLPPNTKEGSKEAAVTCIDEDRVMHDLRD